ncbi:hypothetical protein N658DRAFT_189314 [Parathielavia hyrcaniae]|uniref:DUF6590 domain-containing protein n=1 Tax=Parathielavia hyrcaniae TaxID=113614 RepID=A0AAN6Q9Q5_9PEZI|nr:hypothetical protein N658DRAFT_189314 [Parathielavia hyrcaniae]
MNPIPWGQWTEWSWDASQARWWRARQDNFGNIQYDFQTPRGNTDDLAASLSSVNLEDDPGASYSHEGAYVHDSGNPAGGSADAAVHASSSASFASAQPSFGGKGKSKVKSKHKKDAPKDNLSKHSSKKQPKFPVKNETDPTTGSQEPQDPFYRRPEGPLGSEHLSAASTAAFTEPQLFSDSAYGSSPHDPSFAPAFTQSPDEDQSYDQASTVTSSLEDPERRTRRGRTSDHGTVYPSSSVAEDEPTEDQAPDYYSETTQDPRTHDISGSQLQNAALDADPYLTGSLGASYPRGESSAMAAAAQNPLTHDDDDDALKTGGGRETPRGYREQTTVAAAPDDSYYQAGNTPGGQELHPQAGAHDGSLYVLEHSSKFRPGMIFKIMWCEPLGAGAHNKSIVAPTNHVRYQQDGRTFYQGLRRFIVVANDEGHCTCVPILTYERQGCNKRGVKPAKHGIIYQAGRTPRMLAGEPRLGFDPVRVHLAENSEKLSKESRVNYAKLTTVEHNFPVYFIGYVNSDDFRDIVRPAVDYCWAKKRRHD